MKKSIFLFFAAILCAMSANAAQVTPNGKYFYFKTSSTWNVDNPRYAVYFAWRNGGAEDKTWVSCQTVPGTTDILYVTAPGEFWDIYFCRMNGSTTDNKDANVWNKTDKLQYDGSKNYWKKSTGWNGSTTYSTYVPAISSVTLLDNGTNIISGTGTQADPYLVYVETTIKVKGAGTKVLEDPDAKLNYKFKQGTTSKQEGTSATYQFTASATADTEYTINLDGYTKVNTTKSTVTKSATALYYKTVERAEETNTVTISYKCGDKDVQTGITEVVGVSTTSSFTAPTNITGYKFTNWTIGAGIDLKAGTASDATITVVTKSASSDYTLVANYEEVLETVYFINTIKWARVNIHKWNGKAAASSWPGEKLTASGEKIGEYDVYSYTAKEGDYANIIFNSKTSGTDGGNAQTADLTWTAGEYYIYNYNGNSGWYTKEDAEALLVAPVVEETVYFVNNKNWTKVQAYAWNATGNNGWPGVALTATGEKVEGFDVYSYTAPQGYTNIIFNNKTGETGVQSADFKWTAGKYYYMGADKDYAGGTKEEVADKVAVEIPQEAVYFINTGEWKGVNIYGWDGTVAMGWPGTAMNETSEVVNGKEGKVFKVYSHSADQGAYKNIKFNNTENNDTQSSNLEWKNGKYYALSTGKWYDDLATAEADLNIYNIKLAGPMTKWADEAKEFAVTGTTGTLTITLTAGVHEFKIIEDGEWKGNSGTMTRGNRTNWTFDSGDNAKIFAEVEGDYTFSWDATTDKLTVVTYPNTYPAISIVGTMNEWNKATNQSNVVTDEKTSISIDLEAGKLHEFKVAIDTIMLGNEGTMIKSETDWTFEWQKGNAKLTTQAEGTYVFTWNHATHKLSVEYPATTEPLNKLTYTVTVPAGTKKCYIAGDMTSWAFKEMINKGNNVFSIEIEGAIEAHKYKYSASDSWAHQEVKADGSNVDNRTYNAQDVVEKWAEPLVYTVKVPAGTKKCFLAGDMNGWSFTEMTDMGNNTFSIEYGTATSDHKYKYTCNADWAYVEKKNGNDEVDNRTYNANDVVERWNRIDIADGENAAIIGSHAGKGKVEVYVDREFKAGQLYTISLPFAVADADGLFGSGTVVYEYADLKYENDEYALYFDNTKNAMEAGKPYLVNPGSDRDGFEYKDTEVVFSEKAISKTVNNTTISMVSVLSVTTGATTNGKYWLASDTYLYNVSSALKSLRAVFDITTQSNMPPRVRIAQSENVETGVEDIIATDAPVKVIVNGQLIIIRDGVKYNVQGQLVK